MLKGFIEQISETAISGWVYCANFDVAGHRLLAFERDQCIGAGHIDIHRPDLEAAGMGKGLLGFSISCDPAVLKRHANISVRLDNSDFALLPRSTSQRPARREVAAGLFSSTEARRVEWMARQGWLSQEQFLALRSLNQLGVYQRTFSRSELGDFSLERKAADLYLEIMCLLFRSEFNLAQLQEHSLMPRDLAQLDFNLAGGEHGVIGLYGGELSAEVSEGAHALGIDGAEPPVVAPVSYRCAPHQLLLVHTGCLRSLALGKGSGVQLLALAAPAAA
ncbi:hypothetical protein LRH25_22705 [Ideonella azotifigens]|uniref:Uncharacterized protein n=1 Tax=Ideonella azotifigens TaxID=513160 RepID=A0ABN1KCF6_9BURK|nr:hypothetical protein [Ideonella azotifigens]MCD2343142.1 hypothetical protein [Ideonella azotifigens]